MRIILVGEDSQLLVAYCSSCVAESQLILCRFAGTGYWVATTVNLALAAAACGVSATWVRCKLVAASVLRTLAVA